MRSVGWRSEVIVSSSNLLYREAGCVQFGSELVAGVVQRLVEGSPSGGESLGENVDGDAVECESNEDLALMSGQLALNRIPQAAHEIAALGLLLGGHPVALEEGPALRFEYHLVPLPRPPPELDAGFEQGELVGPRREPALPAEVVQFRQNGDERIVRRLRRDVLELLAPDVRERGAPSTELMARSREQHGVKALRRLLADGSVCGSEGLDPGSRLRVDSALAGGRRAARHAGPSYLHHRNVNGSKVCWHARAHPSGWTMRAASSGGHPRSMRPSSAWRSKPRCLAISAADARSKPASSRR